jgi:hypothetical protein
MSSSLNTIASYVTSTIQSDAAPADTFYFVDSVDELRTVSKADFKYVATKGYYSAGSGGGGAYWYDATDVTSLDNGFNIIVAIDGGRWKLIIDKPDVKQAGAKGDGVTNDTMSIQTVIDYVYGLGGGYVHLPSGTYNVAASSVGGEFWGASGTVKVSVNARTCLLLRSGVTIIGDGIGATTIFNTDRTLSIISLSSMDGGGIRNMTLCSDWNSGPNTGTGNGIYVTIWEFGDFNQNIVFDNLEIHSVGSYGIGVQWGNQFNNRYNNLHIYNTGADGIDHKVRGGAVTPATSRAISFSNILVEQYGRRSGILESAGIDVRGPATIVNYVAKDFGVSGTANVGIRFSAGTTGVNLGEQREPSSFSTLTNFAILSTPEFATRGIVLLDSSHTTVSNGAIKGCTGGGVAVETAASGFWNTIGTMLANISVFGSRTGASFSAVSDARLISFINCISTSEHTIFCENSDNLTAGQTIFEIDVNSATAIVLKNNVVLTLTTDYTITDTVLTLVVGALISDKIEVIYPTSVGFDIDSPDSQLNGCSSYYNITPLTVGSPAVGNLRLSSNNFGYGYQSNKVLGDTVYMEPYDTAADVDFKCYAKGTGGFEVRSRGARALRADNSTVSCVNWVAVGGSLTGESTTISSQGSDANIDIRVISKGTGGVELRSNNSRALRAENTGTSSVNWVTVKGSATGVETEISAQGADADIDLRLNAKGNGKLQFGAWTSNVDAAINGYIEIKDSSGNSIKLATIA